MYAKGEVYSSNTFWDRVSNVYAFSWKRKRRKNEEKLTKARKKFFFPNDKRKYSNTAEQFGYYTLRHTA